MAEASHFLHPRDNLVETQFRAILPENSPQVHNAFLTNLLSRYLTEAAERGAAMKEKGGGRARVSMFFDGISTVPFSGSARVSRLEVRSIN